MMLFCDIVVEVVTGHPEQLILLKAMWLLDYFFALGGLAFFHCYLMYGLKEKTKLSNKCIWPVIVLCGVMLVLWIVSLTNGMFYVITPQARYIYSPNFFVSQLGYIAILIVDFIFIIIQSTVGSVQVFFLDH